MTFSSEEGPKGKLQTVWIWNPGKFSSFCTGVLKMYNFGQIPSAILVDWAVFRTFLDFTKMWARWNFESIFLKIVHQKGLFDAIKENPNFLSCREILDIYRQWLLKSETFYYFSFFKEFTGSISGCWRQEVLRILEWPQQRKVSIKHHSLFHVHQIKFRLLCFKGKK